MSTTVPADDVDLPSTAGPVQCRSADMGLNPDQLRGQAVGALL